MASRLTIDVTFKQLATTLIERSERGIAILLLNDSTAAEDKVYYWNYTTGENTLSATVAGSTNTSNASSVTVSGTTYSTSLKMDSNAKITFSTANSGTHSLITYSTQTIPTVIIDDVEYGVSTKGQTDIELSASSHTIVKGTTNTYLYYVGVKVLGTDGVITNTYKTVADINEELYTSKSVAHIKKCLNYAPYEVIVISGATVQFVDFALAILKASSTGWIAFAGETSPQADLASWIISIELQDYTYKGIGTISGKDCKQYVYFNQTSTDTDGESLSVVDYLSSLLGIVAGCNVSRGCTNFLCTDLSSVDEVDDVDFAIDAGQLVLTNDIGGVRIVTGINSLVTLNGSTATEDMQYIETVEAMNLIKDDIREEFKTTYQGVFKNKYTNQMLFIGAVNAYFDDLAAEDILDSEFDNKAEIDVDSQRSAWVGSGNSEAEDWDDDTVKSMAYKRTVFIAANVKILNCMENLKFNVTME